MHSYSIYLQLKPHGYVKNSLKKNKFTRYRTPSFPQNTLLTIIYQFVAMNVYLDTKKSSPIVNFLLFLWPNILRHWRHVWVSWKGPAWYNWIILLLLWIFTYMQNMVSNYFKGTLMQISKSPYMFVFISKQ